MKIQEFIAKNKIHVNQYDNTLPELKYIALFNVIKRNDLPEIDMYCEFNYDKYNLDMVKDFMYLYTFNVRKFNTYYYNSSELYRVILENSFVPTYIVNMDNVGSNLKIDKFLLNTDKSTIYIQLSSWHIPSTEVIGKVKTNTLGDRGVYTYMNNTWIYKSKSAKNPIILCSDLGLIDLDLVNYVNSLHEESLRYDVYNCKFNYIDCFVKIKLNTSIYMEVIKTINISPYTIAEVVTKHILTYGYIQFMYVSIIVDKYETVSIASIVSSIECDDYAKLVDTTFKRIITF